MKTVNLELSQQLKANGYPQEGMFWYDKDGDDHYMRFVGDAENFTYASPSADEILDQLPERIEGYKSFGLGTISGEWHIGYQKIGNELQVIKFVDKYLANACAKLWLYLKKEGLL